MTENLRVTKYRNGDPILNVTDNNEWMNLTMGGYCWYNQDITNKPIYGALYNFYAVIDTRNIAPIGWHVPNETEWDTLINFIGGSASIGKLKESGTKHWKSPNTGATDEYGFSALPAGQRAQGSGGTSWMGEWGSWWKYRSNSAGFCPFIRFEYNKDFTGMTTGSAAFYGMSVLCIKD